MEIYGNGWLTQKEKGKQKYKCRKWMIGYRTELGCKYKYFLGTYREALKAKEAFGEALLNDSSISNFTFEQYANKWLKWRQDDKDLSPNTKHKDRFCVQALNYWFGKYKLSELNPPLIKDIMAKYSSPNGTEYSGTTKNYHFTWFNRILETAVSDGALATNPFKSIKIPKIDTKEKRALNREEFKQMIECLNKETLEGRPMAIYLMLYLGLRRQEAFALQWDDIDFQNKKVHIHRAYKNADGSVGETKTKAGNRTLPIPAPLLEKLEQWKKIYPPSLDHNVICISTLYKPITPTTAKQWFNRFCTRNNIEHITFHELRHTNLTIAARKMNQFDLQRYAGWSSLAPARIYIHADDESMTNSVNAMFD